MSRSRLAGPLLGLGVMSAALAAPADLSVSLSPRDPALGCGAKMTPTLRLSGTPPRGTKSLALIFWDQRPNRLSGRWTVFDLPLSTGKLGAARASALNVAGGKVATNETGKAGYTAICSKGRHDIYIDYYALDVARLNLKAGAPLQTVHAAIKRHKLLETKAHIVLELK